MRIELEYYFQQGDFETFLFSCVTIFFINFQIALTPSHYMTQ